MLNSLFRNTLALFSYIIPKNNNMLVFMPIHDRSKFSGNISSLYLYANANEKSYDLQCIALKPKIYTEIKKMGFPVVPQNLKMFWLLLRAKHIIIDGTYSNITKGNFSLIQLWHGTGFKNVGLLNDNLSDQVRSFFLGHCSKYTLIVANSDSDKQRKNDAFNSKNAIATGSPRNDVLFSDGNVIREIKERYDLAQYDKILAYVPTYRDFETKEPFTAAFWSKLNDFLVESNQVLVVKKHPWDKYLDVPPDFQNIKDLSAQIADVQELLLISDLLISDYSSVVADYIIMDKPILFYFYDYNEYKKSCRNMYYDINQILPGPFSDNEDLLLSQIKDLSWFDNPEIKKKYKIFSDMFHKYRDNNSCQRVFNKIKEL